MALNTCKCNCLTPLHFKGLIIFEHYVRSVCRKFCKDPLISFQDILLTLIDYADIHDRVIFVNENENDEKRENNEFVNKN